MNRIRTRPLAWVLSSLLLMPLTACSGGSDDAGAGGEDPAEAFETLEQRLLQAPTSRVDFTITATGTFEADLAGTLLLAEEGRARLESRGTFGGEEISLLLVSDGRRMRMTNGTDTAEAETPPGLKEALVIGLTRMGVLHNLARLTEVAPPDHADGDVRSWVEAVDMRREERGSLGFDIRVAGQRSGSARLFLAPGTGLPGQRLQTVSFPDPDAGGDEVRQMEVSEVYGAVSLGADVEPDDFRLD